MIASILKMLSVSAAEIMMGSVSNCGLMVVKSIIAVVDIMCFSVDYVMSSRVNGLLERLVNGILMELRN